MRFDLHRLIGIRIGVCLLSLGAAGAPAQSTLIDLGQFAPALGINNNGQVVLQHYIYSNGTLTPLPAGMCGLAINNNGVVLGTYAAATTACPNSGTISVYAGGVLTQYSGANDLPAHTQGPTAGINDSGTIAGFDGSDYLVMNGVVTRPGNSAAQYAAINDASQIIVNSPGDPFSVYPLSTTALLNGSAAGNGWGYAVNASGDIAGYHLVSQGNIPGGDIVTQSAALFLGGNGCSAFPSNASVFYGINATDFAVGDLIGLSLPAPHAALYNGDATAAADLNNFVLPNDPLRPYVTLEDARGINDTGLVVVNGMDSSTNTQHVYLLAVPLVKVGTNPACTLIAFDSVSPGTTSAPLSSTFTNQAATSISLGGATITPSDFVIQSNDCGVSLASGASCSVSVAYSPIYGGTEAGSLSLLASGVPITMTLTGSAPLTASIKASAATVAAGTAFTLTWTSNAPPGACSATGGASLFGGAPPDGWSGTLPSSGTRSITEAIVSTAYLFGIKCVAGAESQASQVKLNITSPKTTATLSASPSSVSSGAPITLTWTSSEAAACEGSGGGTNDGWAGATLSANGNRAITEPLAVAPGQSEALTFTITCQFNSSTTAASASAKVTQLGPVASSASYGGGAFDWVSEMSLFALLGWQCLRRSSRR